MLLFFKIMLVVVLLYIVLNLALAGIAMVRGKPHMRRYLGRRVGFSVLLLAVLMVGIATGLVPLNPRPYG